MFEARLVYERISVSSEDTNSADFPASLACLEG